MNPLEFIPHWNDLAWWREQQRTSVGQAAAATTTASSGAASQATATAEDLATRSARSAWGWRFMSGWARNGTLDKVSQAPALAARPSSSAWTIVKRTLHPRLLVSVPGAIRRTRLRFYRELYGLIGLRQEYSVHVGLSRANDPHPIRAPAIVEYFTGGWGLILIVLGLLLPRIHGLVAPQNPRPLSTPLRTFLRLPSLIMLTRGLVLASACLVIRYADSIQGLSSIKSWIELHKRFIPFLTNPTPRDGEAHALWAVYTAMGVVSVTEEFCRSVETVFGFSLPALNVNLFESSLLFYLHLSSDSHYWLTNPAEHPVPAGLPFNPLAPTVDLFICTVLIVSELLVSQILGCFGKANAWRLIPSTIFGLTSMFHLVVVLSYRPASYPPLMLLSRLPELFVLIIMASCASVHFLAKVVNGRRPLRRALFGFTSNPFGRGGISLSEDFSLALFKMMSATIESTKLVGMLNEVAEIAGPSGTWLDQDVALDVDLAVGSHLARSSLAKSHRPSGSGFANEEKIEVVGRPERNSYRVVRLGLIKRLIYDCALLARAVARLTLNQVPLLGPWLIRRGWLAQIRPLIRAEETRELARISRSHAQGTASEAFADHDHVLYQRFLAGQLEDEEEEESGEWRAEAEDIVTSESENEGDAHDSNHDGEQAQDIQTELTQLSYETMLPAMPAPPGWRSSLASSSALQVPQTDWQHDSPVQTAQGDTARDLNAGDIPFTSTLLAHLTDASAMPMTRQRFRSLAQPSTSTALARTGSQDTRWSLAKLRSGAEASSASSLEAERLAAVLRERRTLRMEARAYLTTSSDASLRQRAPALELMEDEQQQMKPCVVCCDAGRNVILWPCRCLALCDECRQILIGKQLRSCPTCRSKVDGYSRIFVP